MSPLLPETIRILDSIHGATTSEDLVSLNIGTSGRTGSYRALPEPNLPHLRFHITDISRNLLAFVGRTSPGFEVLQVVCSGLQYHWRSDLVRVLDEEIPLVSRLLGLSDERELVVEHLALPVVRRHRVREILGWFTFGQELDACGEWANPNGASMFRKSERSRSVQLPTRLFKTDDRATSQGMLTALKTRWRTA